MDLQFDTLNTGIRLIKLSGKMDIVGTGRIEKMFTGYCAGENVRVIVDLSRLEYLSSTGIRLFLATYKSLSKRCGKMVLVDPIPEIKHVLEVAGVPSMIPVYSHLESAETVLLAP